MRWPWQKPAPKRKNPRKAPARDRIVVKEEPAHRGGPKAPKGWVQGAAAPPRRDPESTNPAGVAALCEQAAETMAAAAKALRSL